MKAGQNNKYDAYILKTIFGWDFGTNDDLINSF